jgi:hypothetical protein
MYNEQQLIGWNNVNEMTRFGMPGVFYRSRDGLTAFESWPEFANIIGGGFVIFLEFDVLPERDVGDFHRIEAHHLGPNNICRNHVQTSDENADRTRCSNVGTHSFHGEYSIDDIEVGPYDFGNIDQTIGEIESPMKSLPVPERDEAKEVLDTQTHQSHHVHLHLRHIDQKIDLIQDFWQGKRVKNPPSRDLLLNFLSFFRCSCR